MALFVIRNGVAKSLNLNVQKNGQTQLNKCSIMLEFFVSLALKGLR